MADSPIAPNVFDSLLRDRIIWLGSEVQDENARVKADRAAKAAKRAREG